MFDMSQPVPLSLIIASIIFVVAVVGIGLGLVAYYKKKMNK